MIANTINYFKIASFCISKNRTSEKMSLVGIKKRVRLSADITWPNPRRNQTENELVVFSAGKCEGVIRELSLLYK